MNDLVEKVARALRAADYSCMSPEYEGDYWTTLAQAAIEATGVVELREALERISSGRSSVTECSLFARQALTQLAKGSER